MITSAQSVASRNARPTAWAISNSSFASWAPVVETRRTSCSGASARAISQARIAGPAIRSESGSPVTTSTRRRDTK